MSGGSGSSICNKVLPQLGGRYTVCCGPPLTPGSLLERVGCLQQGAATTCKHPDLYSGWRANSPGLSHVPGCPGAAALAHPQPRRQGGRGAADAPPSGGAGWPASLPRLRSSGLVSGWSASGSLERGRVRHYWKPLADVTVNPLHIALNQGHTNRAKYVRVQVHSWCSIIAHWMNAQTGLRGKG